MRTLALKSLIWLVAVLTAAHPLAAGGCPCAVAGSCDDEAETQQRAAAEKACCQEVRDCCVSDPVENNSCCPGAARDSSQRCCKGTGDCSCRMDDTVPPKQPAPVDNSRTADELVQPPSAVFSSSGEFLIAPVILGDNSSPTASGLERCIVLCRFNL